MMRLLLNVQVTFLNFNISLDFISHFEVISEGAQPCAQICVMCHFAGRLLTDTNSDEERDICEHLPQHVPEVPFSTAVTVLHQLCAPQNCKETQARH